MFHISEEACTVNLQLTKQLVGKSMNWLLNMIFEVFVSYEICTMSQLCVLIICIYTANT